MLSSFDGPDLTLAQISEQLANQQIGAFDLVIIQEASRCDARELAALLRGRKVLVVDDDVRNIFALTTLLEGCEVDVVTATNGRQAIQMVETTPDLSMVLMDIMMPDMDGYQTMREIRRNPQLRSLPILALTAKAMKGDREKCLEAGASDYIAKPVNTDQLLSLMRVWLFR